jgi:hypothetical protein
LSLQSVAEAEGSKNLLSRDFWCRSIFDFCNNICQMQTMARSERHRGLGYSEAKSHLSYFDEYFSTVGAKMILTENPYTDRDYLENCAAYYARCDAGYDRSTV